MPKAKRPDIAGMFKEAIYAEGLPKIPEDLEEEISEYAAQHMEAAVLRIMEEQGWEV